MGNPLGINIKLKLDDKELKENLGNLKNTEINLGIKNFTEINNNFNTLVGYIDKLKDFKGINPLKGTQLRDIKEVVTLLKEVNELNKGIKINVYSDSKKIIDTEKVKGQLGNEEKALKEFAKGIGLSLTEELKEQIKKAMNDESVLGDITKSKLFKEDKASSKELSKKLIKPYEDAIKYLKEKTFYINPLQFNKEQSKEISDSFRGYIKYNKDKEKPSDATYFGKIKKEFMEQYGHLIPSGKDIKTTQDFALALTQVVNKYKDLKKGNVGDSLGLAEGQGAEREAKALADVTSQLDVLKDKLNAIKSTKDMLKNVSSVSVETDEIKEENKELDKQNEKLEKKHKLVQSNVQKTYKPQQLDSVREKYNFTDGVKDSDPSEVTKQWTEETGKVFRLVERVNAQTGDLEKKLVLVTDNYKKQREELEKIEVFKSKMQNNINNLISNKVAPKDKISELQNSINGLDKNATKVDFQEIENQYKNLLKLEKELQTEIKNRQKLQEQSYKDNDNLEAFKSKKINEIEKLYSNKLVPKEEIKKLENALSNLKIGFSKKDQQDIENIYNNLINREKELKKIRGEDLVSRAQKTQGTRLDDLKIKFKGFYDVKEIEEFRKELDSLSPTSKTLTEDIIKLNNKIKEFKNELTGRQKISKLGIDISDVNTGLNTKSSEEDIKKLVSEIGGISAEIKQIDSQPIIENGNEVRKVTYRVKEGNEKWHEYQLAIVQAGSTGETSLKKLDKGLKDVINREVSFTQRIKNAWMAVASFAGVTSVFYNIVHGFRNGINSVIELDTAMVGLKKVTDETEETYNSFATTANKMAIAVGHSTKSAIESTAEFAKLGYTLKDSAKLAQEALIYSNIGDIDIADATQSITATMKGFNLTADDTRHILDALNEVGNNFAISTGGIGDALQRSASALNEANNSFEESVGLITAGNASVQDVEKVGNSLKTISMRLRGISEESGEAIPKLREDIKDIANVDIMIDNDTFKSTYQILTEISKVWSDLTDKDRATLMEKIAGKQQGNIFASIMANMKDGINATETALNSMGSASLEQEKYMESIQARMNTFKETAVEFWSNLIDGQTIKNFVDSGTSIIRILDTLFNKTGSVNIGFSLIATALLGLSSQFRGFLSNLIKYDSEIGKIVLSTKKGQVAFSDLGLAFKNGATSGGIFTGVTAMMNAGLKSVALSAVATKIAVMGLQVVLTAGLSLAVTSIISLLSTFVGKLFEAKKPIEEISQAFSENIQGNNSNIQYLKQISEEYEKLSGKTSLSTEEFTKLGEMNSSIGQMFPNLIKGYDDQGNAILNLTDGVKGLIGELEKANKVEALKFLEEGNKSGSFEKSFQDLRKAQEEFDKINKQIELNNNGGILKGGAVPGTDGTAFKGIKQLKEELASLPPESKKAQQVQEQINKLAEANANLSNSAIISTDSIKKQNEQFDFYKRQLLVTQSAFENMDAKGQNFAIKYTESLKASDFKDFEDLSNHIKNVTKALSENPKANSILNDIESLNKEMSTMDTKSYEAKLNELLKRLSDVSKIDPNILSKILKVDPKDIKNLSDAGNAVDELKAKLEQSKKDFGSAEDGVDFYEGLQKEFEEYGRLSANSIREIIEKHEELIPYLNNESALRKKITSLIGDQRKKAVEAYKQIIMDSTEYYNLNIKGTNTLEKALDKYHVKVTGDMKKQLSEATSLAKARVILEGDTTKKLLELNAKYAENASHINMSSILIKSQKDSPLSNSEITKTLEKSKSWYEEQNKTILSEKQKAQQEIDNITKAFDSVINVPPTISDMSNNLEKLKDSTDKAKYSADAYANAMKTLQVQMDALNSSMSKLYKNSWDYISALDKKKELLKQQIELTKQEISLNEKLAGGYKGGTGVSATSSTTSTKNAGVSIGEQIVNEANKYLGTPYLWGGTTTKGFDCSGLVQYVYKQLNIDINRVSQDQIKNGRAVAKNQLQEGDLVFFGDSNAPHHVGIYAGNGQYIHAPKTGDVVKVSNLNDRSDFAGARRIVSDPSAPATGGKISYQNKTSTKNVTVEEATDRAWNEAQDLKQKLIQLQQEYDDIKFEKYTSTIGILDDKIKRTDVNAGIYQTRATEWSTDLTENFKNFDSYINEIQEKNKVLLEKQKYMQNEIWYGGYNSDQLVNMRFELQDTVAEIENMTKALQDAFQEKWDFKFEFDNRSFEDFDQYIDDAQDKIDLLNENDLDYNSEKSSLLNGQIGYQEKYINLIQKARVEILAQRDKLKENSWEWNYLNDKAKEYEEKMDDIAKAIKQQNDELKSTLNDGLDNLTDIESKVIDLIKKRYEEEERLAKEAIDKKRKAEEKRHKEQLDNYEEEKKAFEEIIKLQLKDLDKEENQRTYEKDLNKMEEEKAKLQYSYDSLLMDGSLEAQVKRAELAEQIAKKQEEIKEFQHKHSLDLRKENLNDQLEAFQKEQDKKIDKENDEYEKFKEKLDKKEKATEEHYKELLKQDNLYSEAKKAIFAGEIEYIDGELMELGEALMKYEDEWGNGMSLLGTKIKSELIANLQKAIDTANNLDSILDKINDINKSEKDSEEKKVGKVYAQSDSNKNINDYLTAKKYLEKLGYDVVDVTKLSKAEQDAIKLSEGDVVLGNALQGKNLNGADRLSGSDRYETEEMTKAYASYTEKAIAGDVSDIKKTVYGWGKDLTEGMKWLSAMGYKFVNSKDMTAEELASVLNSGDIVLGGSGVTPISDELLKQLGAIRLGGATSQDTLDMIMSWAKNGGIPRYSKGGLINHTGLAYVDGTSSSPEIAINNSDAGKLFGFIKNIPNSLYDMIPQLNSAFNLNSIKSSGLASMATPSLSIDNLINVEGNLDKSTMPQLKDITNDVLRELQKVFNKSGFFRKIK